MTRQIPPCARSLDSFPQFHDLGNMETKTAIEALSALAQERRLEVFRLLVRAGRSGMAAGAIADALGVPANTLSAQLNILSQAGLIEGMREGRSIIYSVRFDAVSELVVWLMEDCCAGERAVAGPVEMAASRCCAPETPIC